MSPPGVELWGGGYSCSPPSLSPRSGAVLLCPDPALGCRGLLALLWVWGCGAVCPLPYPRVWGGGEAGGGREEGQDALCPLSLGGGDPSSPIPCGQTLLAPWIGAAPHLQGSSSGHIPGVWGGGEFIQPYGPHSAPPPPQGQNPFELSFEQPPRLQPEFDFDCPPRPGKHCPMAVGWLGWGGCVPIGLNPNPPCPPPRHALQPTHRHPRRQEAPQEEEALQSHRQLLGAL